MVLATWNVNSLKARGAHVLDWIRATRPDVLGLQELKMADEVFPFDVFEEAGYLGTVYGQRTWNGVALLSRDALVEVDRGLPTLPDDAQARCLTSRLGAVRLINVYVPNGESLDSPKFDYKMRWLDALARHLESSFDPAEPLAIFGDFNIAPAEPDVHDPEELRDRVLFSEAERVAFARLQAWGLVDLYRHLQPDGRDYSWWDYRQGAFRRNLGLRIDHILVTRPLLVQAVSCQIDRAPRGWERPSDHAPVVAVFQ